MANSAKLTDGTTEYEFVYDSATQDDYKLRYGMTVGGSEPRPLWHTPDNAPPRLVRLTNENQVIFLKTIVYGTDRDDVLNNLIPIKRWVDGGSQQAARYHTDGDVNEIKCRIQLDSATNYTDWSVIYGNVDDSASFYNAVSNNNTLALDVIVMLVCEPLGKGSAISLRNDLQASGHFIIDSNGDDICNGWNATSNPATYDKSFNRWLIGGQSQKFTAAASGDGEGLRSDSTTAPTSSTAVMYIWIHAEDSADDIVDIELTDGNNNIIASVQFDPSSPAGYDKSITGFGSGAFYIRTWYRYSLTGSNTTAAGFRIRVWRTSSESSSGGDYFLDGAYLEVGNDTAPDAWCSTSNIENRNDTTNANPERFNYVDVWGVPGDANALIDTAVECTAVTGTKDVVIGARQSDGSVLATDVLHWVDDADMTLLILSGSQSNPSDANRSAGEYIRHTADASSVDQATLTIDIGSTYENLVDFLSIPHRVFLITRSSSASTTYEMQVGSGYTFLTGGAVATSPNAANTWELLDLGYLNKIDSVIGDYGQTPGTAALSVYITPGATSATVDIDACLLVPASAGGLCVVNNTSVSAASDYVTQFIGSEGIALGGRDTTFPGANGELWTIPSGNKMSRFIFAYTNSTTNVHHLTDSADVSFTITPRTRHLLGTS